EYLAGTNPRSSDHTAPSVSFTLPANGAVNVPLNTAAAVCFSEPMAAASFTGTTLQLRQGPNALPGTITAAGACAAVTPSSPLTASTMYTLFVSGPRDLAGNALASTFTSSFTTGSGTDAAAPTLVRVDPKDGTTDAPTNTIALAEFSEAMNP